MSGTRILVGHVLDQLAQLPDDSVHCVVTSPPYWGLRDYGLEPQVWGGDPACAHVFSNARGSRALGRHDELPEYLERRAADYGTGTAKAAAGLNDRTYTTGGALCACGAWRGSLGLEPTWPLYVEHMVEVFRAIWRVLRPDGTCWLNLGDCYATGAGMVGAAPGGGAQGARWAGTSSARPAMGKHGYAGEAVVDQGIGPTTQPNRLPQPGLKPKDLVGIPWRVGFALQADGWWLRCDNVWHKPAPMPESIRDRCTRAHEFVFQLTKAERYFYDAEASAEPVTGGSHPRKAGNGSAMHVDRIPGVSRKSAAAGSGIKANASFHAAGGNLVHQRNKRTVWTIGPSPYPDAHFATFPPELAETCILAGTSAHGVCAACGAPWERQLARVDTGRVQKMADGWDTAPGAHGTIHRNGRSNGQTGVPVMASITVGWAPSCSCDADVVPAMVLDPFGGSGTVGMVCERLGRDAILVELSPKYAAMARRRIDADQVERRQLAGDQRHRIEIRARPEPTEQLPLFAPPSPREAAD